MTEITIFTKIGKFWHKIRGKLKMQKIWESIPYLEGITSADATGTTEMYGNCVEGK